MKLRDSWIPDQSHTVLDGLGDEAIGFFIAAERKLSAIGDAGVYWRMQSGETGFLRGLFGKRRDVLVINHKNFPEYNVVLAARAHGTALHLAWLLLIEPRFAKDLRRAFQIGAEPGTRFEIGSEMDAIDLIDLRAFLGITRMVFKDAIRALTNNEPEDNDDAREISDVE